MVGLAKKLRRVYFWELLSVVLFALLVVSFFNNGFIFDVNSKSKEEVGKEAVEFINSEIFKGQVEGKLVSVGDEYGLYAVKIDIEGQEFDSYVTKDGKILFPQGVEMGEVETAAPSTPSSTGSSESNIPKNTKPVVDLFVMSQCPYGTIAEKAIAPVLDLLKDKVKFNLYFIANDIGGGNFRSLHGQPEVDENIRQVCIAEEYSRDILMDYLLCVADDYRNVGNIWKGCVEDNEISISKIEKCFEGEGKDLFAKNIIPAEERGVGGSPTLMINGVRYTGARTSDGYKEGICSGFSEEPSECEKVLSSTTNAVAGSC